MTLLIDNREHDMMKRLVKGALQKFAPDANEKISLDKAGSIDIGSKAKVVQLEVGDYADPKFGFAVERKSEDLWDEIENGNLFAKLQELSQYPHAFFLVDKPITEVFKDIKKKVFYKPRLTSAQKIAEYNRRKLRLFGAIASCSLRGFPPIFCSDRREAAELIVRMYYKARDSKDRSEVVATRPTATHKDRAMRVLLSYPFIGDKTAEKLLEKYGSVGEVNQALLNLFEKPNKKLMRELGLNRKQLDNAVAILVGDVD